MQDENRPQDLSDDQLNGVTGGAGAAVPPAIGSTFGAEMNIPEMMMAIQQERAGLLDTQIKGQMTDMQDRNGWLRDANAAMAALRTNLPTDGSVHEYGSFTDHDGKTRNVHDWMTANGIGIETAGNDKAGVRGEFDQAINNLKANIDTVNSQSQMDMIRLQGLMDKRNQAFDLMTNMLSKTGKQTDQIIGNMR